ncbi:MAG: glycosyltransferase family 2 protein [Promethearchaeota archaeon]
MNNNVKISVIFPSYNGETVIRKLFESVLNLKNLNEIEFIVVDNHSQDSTVDIIKSYNEYINLQLIEENQNLGFGEACNKAASLANGKYLFITNQDVEFDSDFFIKIEKIYQELSKDRDIILSPSILFFNKYINYFGAKIHFLGFSYTPNMYKPMNKNEIKTFRTLKASGCSLFLKKELFLKIGGFNPNYFMYHEDTDLSLKALSLGIPIYTTNEIYLNHQKLHMLLNNFTYYYLERNRFYLLYKNIKNIYKILPHLIVLEFILLFQAFLLKKLKIRFKIYKFLIQNFKFMKNDKYKRYDLKFKITIDRLSCHFDPIILGPRIMDLKTFRFFLKILNLIF